MLPAWLLLLTPLVVGIVLVVTASDPYTWGFDAGLILVGVGLVSPWFRWAWRLHAHHRRVWRIFGRGVGLATAIIVLLGLTVAVDHRLLVFRRGSADQWRQDLAELQRQATLLPEGLQQARGATFRKELDTLSTALDTLDDNQRQIGLMRVVASLADGHSVAFPFFPSTDFQLAPLQIRRFADGWSVVDAAARYGHLVRSQVTRINGTDVEAAYAAIAPYVSADNEFSRVSRAALYLMSPDLLSTVTGRAGDGLELTLQHPDGSIGDVRISAEAPWRYLAWRFDPRSYDARPWWITDLPDRKALLVTIRAIRGDADQPFSSLAGLVLEGARRIGANRVIIDVRGNGGGDNTLLPRFVNDLAASEFNVSGRLFVLTDADTFSAATNLVSMMESKTSAIQVGAPTGSGPNHFGDSGPIRLPGTGAVVFLSTREHRFGGADDARVAHEPARRPPQLAADYFARRDLALEAALNW